MKKFIVRYILKKILTRENLKLAIAASVNNLVEKCSEEKLTKIKSLMSDLQVGALAVARISELTNTLAKAIEDNKLTEDEAETIIKSIENCINHGLTDENLDSLIEMVVAKI